MVTKMKIDFVSDVSCPWCAVGLGALQRAVKNVEGDISVDVHFQPFELNPDMPPGGQNVAEHIAAKYGMSDEQLAQNQENIRQRGADVGFTFNMDKRSRIYNTFDAHRLLHWAELEGEQQQSALKWALFSAYFTDGGSPEDHALLVSLAVQAGLDGARAAQILASDEYADAVREREQFYIQQGIRSVPSVIINDRHLISGGQPAEVFESALRQIASQA